MDSPNLLKKIVRSIILVLTTIILPIQWCIPAGAIPPPEMIRVRRTCNWLGIRATANRLLARDPGNQYCLECLVEASIQLRRFDEARAVLIRLRKDHANPQPYLWALLESMLGNYKEADKYVDAMLTSGPPSKIQLQLSEKIAYKVDRNRWMQLCVNHYKLHHASWYFSGGNSGDHDIALREVMALAKDRKHGPENLNEFFIALITPVPKTKLTPSEKLLVARALVHLGNEDSALEWCDSVALTNPQETLSVISDLAGLNFKSHSKFRKLLEKLEAVCSNDHEYWYIRSVQSWKEGRAEDALQYCERSLALNLNEKSLWLRFSIDRQEASAQKSTEARSRLLPDLQPLVQKYPSVRSYSQRATVLHEFGRLEEETSDLTHLIAMLPPGPENVDKRLHKAEVEYTLGDLRAAKKTTISVLQVQPDNARAKVLLGKIEKEMKRASMKD